MLPAWPTTFVDKLSGPVVAQYNPDVVLDRPSGLYGTVQFAISDRIAYGIPQGYFQDAKTRISDIFDQGKTWGSIDQSCRSFSINTLIVNDLDPLWKQLPLLEQERKPLYQNDFYSVIPCGAKVGP